MPKPPRLGIIAGGGALPQQLAAAAAAEGRDPFLIELTDAADTETRRPWPGAKLDISAVGKIIATLRGAGCADVVFAGRVARPAFSRLRPDWQGIKLLPRVVAAARRGDDALLRVLVDFLEEQGFRVLGSGDVAGWLYAPEGPLGRIPPDAADLADIRRGIAVVQALGRLDVGQAAVIRDGEVLGVEAAEGTDQLIARCVALKPVGTGGVLVKLAKPQQDRRIDLPTIGLTTVENAARAGLKGLAVESGHTLILDRAALVAAADAAGIFVYGIPASEIV